MSTNTMDAFFFDTFSSLIIPVRAKICGKIDLHFYRSTVRAKRQNFALSCLISVKHKD